MTPIPECPECETPMEAVRRYGHGGAVASCEHCRRLFLVTPDGRVIREVEDVITYLRNPPPP